MQHLLPHSAPRVGMRIGDHLLPAVPVQLDGQKAALVLDQEPPRMGPTRLHLDWDDGRVTELQVDLHAVDGASHVAHMEIRRVDGDWRPFLEYLASTGI